MKRIILILLICILGYCANGQSQFQSPVTRPLWQQQLKVDTLFWLNSTDTTTKNAASYEGALIYQKSDKTLYISNGLFYQPAGSNADLSAYLLKSEFSDSIAAYIDTSKVVYLSDSTVKYVTPTQLGDTASSIRADMEISKYYYRYPYSLKNPLKGVLVKIPRGNSTYPNILLKGVVYGYYNLIDPVDFSVNFYQNYTQASGLFAKKAYVSSGDIIDTVQIYRIANGGNDSLYVWIKPHTGVNGIYQFELYHNEYSGTSSRLIIDTVIDAYKPTNNIVVMKHLPLIQDIYEGDNNSLLNNDAGYVNQAKLDDSTAALRTNVSTNYVNKNQLGANNGVATLDASGVIPNSQVPAIAISETFVVASQAAMLALSQAETGDVAVRTDESKSYILAQTPASTLANWQELLSPTVSNTDQVPEGSTNLYYTDSRARNAISASGDLSYNSGTGVISYSTPSGLPPTGAAGGDLSGTYPNPSVKDNSINNIIDNITGLQSALDAKADDNAVLHTNSTTETKTGKLKVGGLEDDSTNFGKRVGFRALTQHYFSNGGTKQEWHNIPIGAKLFAFKKDMNPAGNYAGGAPTNAAGTLIKLSANDNAAATGNFLWFNAGSPDSIFYANGWVTGRPNWRQIASVDWLRERGLGNDGNITGILVTNGDSVLANGFYFFDDDAATTNSPPASMGEATFISAGKYNVNNLLAFDGNGIAVRDAAGNWTEYAKMSDLPVVPSVYNSAITLKNGGNTLGTFNINQPQNESIDLSSMLNNYYTKTQSDGRYLQSYTETSTLDDVINRGSTTTKYPWFKGGLNLGRTSYWGDRFILSNATNGVFIQTNIPSTDLVMFVLHVWGLDYDYSSGLGLDMKVFGYMYSSGSAIVSTAAQTNNANISSVDVFVYGGYVCFHFTGVRASSSLHFSLSANYSSYDADKDYKITSVTNAVKPTTGTSLDVTINTSLFAKIDDNNSAASTTYSSNKINALISGAGGGDMLASMYDPQGIADDAFDFGNMTGTGVIGLDYVITNGNSTSNKISLTGVTNSSGGLELGNTSGGKLVLTSNSSNTTYAPRITGSSSSNGSPLVIEGQQPNGNINGIVLRSNLSGTNAPITSGNIVTINNWATNVAAVDYQGNVTANSFIKSGGTSSQVLMADGSTGTLFDGQYSSLTGENSTGKFLATPPSPASGTPTFRAIQSIDLPNVPVSKLTQETPSTYISATLMGSGTPSGSTVLYGDNTWGALPSLTLQNVTDNGATTTNSITAPHFYKSSDLRLKNLITRKNYNNPLLIHMITYMWKDSSRGVKVNYGYAAQEVKQYYPEVVNEDKKGYLSVDYTEMHTLQIEELIKQNKSLKSRVSSLEERISKLEKMILK